MTVSQNTTTGRWYFSCYYRDLYGQRRRKKGEGFPTRREASAAEKAFLDSVDATPVATLAELCEKYLENRKVRVKPTTWQTKCSSFRKHIIPLLGNLPVSDITPATIGAWQTKMLTKHLKPSTLATIHADLSAFFNYAVKFLGVPSNPVKAVGRLGSKRTEDYHLWTPAQFQAVMQYVENPAENMLFSLLFATGLRLGEAQALTVADFDRATRVLNVNKNLVYVAGHYLLLTPKTPRSKRRVILPKSTAAQLAAYIDKLPKKAAPTDTLFPTNVKRSTYRRHLYAAAAAAGVAPIKIHDLRHSHASLLVHLGVPITAIAARLGHDNPAITLKVYSHILPSDEEKVATKLEKAMF